MEWKPLLTCTEQGAQPVGLQGPFQCASASELWCGQGMCNSPSLGLSWALKDEQLALGQAAPSKGTPLTGLHSAPDRIPVPLILGAPCPQNLNQSWTKHLKRGELQTEVLTCRSLSTVGQEQTHPEPSGSPALPVSHSQAMNSTGGECS